MRVGVAGAAVRDAVRRELSQVQEAVNEGAVDRRAAGADGVVLVACSGGPDSLALAAATAFVAPRLGLRAGAVVVDHGLQPGSAAVAATAAGQCRALGLDPVEIACVDVRTAAGDGPEAAARDARYQALDQAAAAHGARAVLLGHTRDDQAESVLLGLLRGSGSRSLAGMAGRRGLYRRPLLDVPRAVTRAACTEQQLDPWADPHNADPTYARSRARDLLADLESRLGPGITAALARSAALLRADADALDEWAEAQYAEMQHAEMQYAETPYAETQHAETRGAAGRPGGLDCAALAELPEAVRTRVLRRGALDAGARPGDLTSTHLAALDALVSDWHGQGPVALPGPVAAVRRCGRLLFAPDARTTHPAQDAQPSPGTTAEPAQRKPAKE